MAIARRFLIASSLTRLIRKERGSERVTEGHFPPQAERQSHVRIEKGQCYLVLTSRDAEVNAAEDWTDVPRSHAEALLDVCPGTAVFERSRLRMGDHEALIDRFIAPAPLDVVSVEFAARGQADAFVPPVWFGSEVTGDDSYTNRGIAISGRPNAPATPLSNDALEIALDLLESYAGEGQGLAQDLTYDGEPDRQADDNVFDRLRRLAAVRPASPLPAAPVGVAEPIAEPPQVGAVSRLKPRRPVLPLAPRRDEGDERLAGVIQGLSEALSQTAEKDGRYGA
jgi:CYTH domain-containing protein